MKSLEIFSGAGGLAKGLECAGFSHAAFVEFNKHACSSLRVNFEAEKVYEGDIRDYDFLKLSGIDVVAGGPPCQPFSLGGKHGANNDTRDMFPYAIKAIETLTPKAFVFENVKGLLRESFSEYFRYILLRLTYPGAHAGLKSTWNDHLKTLEKIKFESYGGIKYRVQHKLIDAADYGVPQNRERVVIVGIRSDIDAAWAFPSPTHSQERLLWDKFVSGVYWDAHRVPNAERETCPKTWLLRTQELRGTFGFFEPELKPWRTVRDALKSVPDPRSTHGIVDHVFRGGARSYPGHTGSDLDWPAKTIKAGGHGVPGGENMMRFRDGEVRYFTVYEAKLIQTFPKDFVILGAWGEALRQIGNAVPVLLAEKIGGALYAKIAAPSDRSSHFVSAKTQSVSDNQGIVLRCGESSPKTKQSIYGETVPTVGRQRVVSVNTRKSQPSEQQSGQRKSKTAIRDCDLIAKQVKQGT
jgi:DNA (cytosine-5)-methyltransferase 1